MPLPPSASDFTSSVRADTFLVKYNADGTPQWFSSLTSGSGNSDKGAKISVDSSGNLYVTGLMSSAIMIAKGPGL